MNFPGFVSSVVKGELFLWIKLSSQQKGLRFFLLVRPIFRFIHGYLVKTVCSKIRSINLDITIWMFAIFCMKENAILSYFAKLKYCHPVCLQQCYLSRRKSFLKTQNSLESVSSQYSKAQQNETKILLPFDDIHYQLHIWHPEGQRLCLSY